MLDMPLGLSRPAAACRHHIGCVFIQSLKLQQDKNQALQQQHSYDTGSR
jgi:hypothetical protein